MAPLLLTSLLACAALSGASAWRYDTAAIDTINVRVSQTKREPPNRAKHTTNRTRKPSDTENHHLAHTAQTCPAKSATSASRRRRALLTRT